MSLKFKYPSTPHLPFSKGVQRDDKVLKNLNGFVGHAVVVTEKLDGENTTLYHNGEMHARSIDGRHHPSRNWIKQFWGEHSFLLSEPYRICGENLYARHSISYDNLTTYFYGFSVWNGETCLDWLKTLEIFEQVGITPAPVLYTGHFNLAHLENLSKLLDYKQVEGFVVRVADEFTLGEFQQKVAKFVRADHVQTDEHWMNSEIVPNKLRDAIR